MTDSTNHYTKAEQHVEAIISHVKADARAAEEIRTAFQISVRTSDDGAHFLDTTGEVIRDPSTGEPAHAGIWFKSLADRRPHLTAPKRSETPSGKTSTADPSRMNWTELHVAIKTGSNAAQAEITRRITAGTTSPIQSLPEPASASKQKTVTNLMIAARRGDASAQSELDQLYIKRV